jgi:serine/threonine protein kinase
MQPHSMADLRRLFDQALELPPVDRNRFLAGVQMRSPLVYEELRKLLWAHDDPDPLFDQDGGIWSQVKPVEIVGRRLGAYEVTREIGRGGMGAVFEARRADDSYSKTVAIKVISSAVLSEDLFASFRRERQILAQLDHPNIATLLDGGATDDGLLYLVMEFIDGQPLDFYALSRNLSIPDVLRLFLDVCSAVSFAHRNLIVHRDLKPSNILVTAGGEVKLLDFGIAKVLDPNRRQTSTLALRLTPEFASPEQIRGGSISTASDVYSIGVLLFHVLTGGKRPYRSTSQAVPDILQSVLSADALRPSSVAPPDKAAKLRGDIDTIILKAMEKQPERRYGSVDQLREDIEHHLTGRPILARSDKFFYRAAKFVNRNRLPVAFALLLLLTLLGGVVSTLSQATEARRQREEAVLARQSAEAQRRSAEQQSRIAIEAQRTAEQQSRLAEQRAREALEQRTRAESRYQSVRSLATAVLFDVNNSLRQVPGTAGARQNAVLAALKHLEALLQQSSRDPALLADIATAYEQVAEIMATSFRDSPEEASLAIPAWQKAIQLRAALNDPIRLADSQRLLGNTLLQAGQSAAALAAYQASLQTVAKALPAPEAERVAAMSHINLCTSYHQSSRGDQSLSHCREAILLLDPNASPSRDNLPLLRGLAHARYGAALRRSRDPALSLEQFRIALAQIDAMDPTHRELLEELIQVTAQTSLHPFALRLLGAMQTQQGQRDEALENFELALKLETGASPAMKDVVAYAEAAALQAQAGQSCRKAQVPDCLALLRRGLDRLSQQPAGVAGSLRTELEQRIRSLESTPAATKP